MDNNIINDDIIEKVVIKSVAIYKAMSVLPAPPFEDKFKKGDINEETKKCEKQIEEITTSHKSITITIENCQKEKEKAKRRRQRRR